MKFLYPFLFSLAATASMHGASAIITWGTVHNVSGVSDINTNGTLVTAANLGTTTSYTLNGVTFTGNTSLWTGSGQGNWTEYGTHTVGGDYAAALSTGRYTNGGSTATLTLTGLTVGQQYELQIWLNDMRDGTPDVIQYSMGGQNVQLTTDNNGGVGGTNLSQYVTGVFTAQATTESLTGYALSGGGGPTLNMFQLRSVPEIGSTLLGAIGFLALLRRRRD